MLISIENLTIIGQSNQLSFVYNFIFLLWNSQQDLGLGRGESPLFSAIEKQTTVTAKKTKHLFTSFESVRFYWKRLFIFKFKYTAIFLVSYIYIYISNIEECQISERF